MALYSEMQRRAIAFYVQYGVMDNGLSWGSVMVYTPPTASAKSDRSGTAGEPVTFMNVEPHVGKLLEQMPLPCLVRFGLEAKPVKKKSGSSTTEIVAVECEVIHESIGKFQEFTKELFGTPKTAVVPPPLPSNKI